MARVALIDNATLIVANVIEAPLSWVAAIGQTARVLGANEACGPGWTFDGVSAFTEPAAPPPPTDVDVLTQQVVALALSILDENNLLRDWITQFKAATAAATSLGNLQTRVAALPSVPQRTRQQLMNAVKGKISDGSVNG